MSRAGKRGVLRSALVGWFGRGGEDLPPDAASGEDWGVWSDIVHLLLLLK